jgi:hypothetical protein
MLPPCDTISLLTFISSNSSGPNALRAVAAKARPRNASSTLSTDLTAYTRTWSPGAVDKVDHEGREADHGALRGEEVAPVAAGSVDGVADEGLEEEVDDAPEDAGNDDALLAPALREEVMTTGRGVARAGGSGVGANASKAVISTGERRVVARRRRDGENRGPFFLGDETPSTRRWGDRRRTSPGR